MIALKITFPAPGDTVLRDMARLSPEIPKAIKRGLDFGMQLVIGLIQEEQLSGVGPYPPDLHRLGTRSEQLRNALRANPAVIAGDTVSVEVVNPTRYAGVHEYGMTIVPKNKKFLSFQIDGKWIRAKKVVIPERSPVRYGLGRNAHVLSEAITEEVNATVDSML